jgi:spore photoproduct lyase
MRTRKEEKRSEVKVNLGQYEVTLRERSGNFIRKFDKTPPGIFCPHFWVIALGQGCPHGCDYCYLYGTYRNLIDFQRPTVYTNQDDMRKEVEKFLSAEEPRVLNTGELSDSLVLEPYTGVMRWLVPMFGRQDAHLLLLLTKSDSVNPILGLEHNGRTRVSFSINALQVAKLFEGSAPSPLRRIQAARLAQNSGYRIGIRIDPMLPVEEWQREYVELLDLIEAFHVKPEVFTLGTLRYFAAVKAFSKVWGRNRSVWEFESRRDGSDGRYRLLAEVRKEMYLTMLDEIRKRWPGVPVGICKETAELRKAIGFSAKDNRCNCTF